MAEATAAVAPPAVKGEKESVAAGSWKAVPLRRTSPR